MIFLQTQTHSNQSINLINPAQINPDTAVLNTLSASTLYSPLPNFTTLPPIHHHGKQVPLLPLVHQPAGTPTQQRKLPQVQVGYGGMRVQRCQRVQTWLHEGSAKLHQLQWRGQNPESLVHELEKSRQAPLNGASTGQRQGRIGGSSGAAGCYHSSWMPSIDGDGRLGSRWACLE